MRELRFREMKVLCQAKKKKKSWKKIKPEPEIHSSWLSE